MAHGVVAPLAPTACVVLPTPAGQPVDCSAGCYFARFPDCVGLLPRLSIGGCHTHILLDLSALCFCRPICGFLPNNCARWCSFTPPRCSGEIIAAVGPVGPVHEKAKHRLSHEGGGFAGLGALGFGFEFAVPGRQMGGIKRYAVGDWLPTESGGRRVGRSAPQLSPNEPDGGWVQHGNELWGVGSPGRDWRRRFPGPSGGRAARGRPVPGVVGTAEVPGEGALMSLRVVGVPNGRGGPELPGLGPGRGGPGSGPGCLARDAVLPQPPRPLGGFQPWGSGAARIELGSSPIPAPWR